MKTKRIIIGAIVALSIGSHAAIVVGDSVGVDFSNNAGTAPNWNTINNPGNGVTPLITDVTALNGSTLTDVDFSFDFTSATNGENTATISGATVGFPDSVLNDVFFQSTSSEQWVLTFTGLDDNLLYDLSLGSYWPAGTAAQDLNRSTGWQVGSQQLVTDAVDVDDSFVTFSDLSPTNGQIIITTFTVAGNNVHSISGLSLTAVDVVPEPSSAALLGLGGLALIVRRRR